jgi:hypothetical protein
MKQQLAGIESPFEVGLILDTLGARLFQASTSGEDEHDEDEQTISQ